MPATLAATLATALAALTVLVPARGAAAQPAGPLAGKPYMPPEISVTSASGPLARLLERNVGALKACAAGERTPRVKGRVSVRWDRAGRTRAISVLGGSRAFDRCASRALAGILDDVHR
ncbi:MAG TPA: hypothetical protein VHE35_30350, partial [Kofleriaceae bacterium]|nr:hypothetical protein [Kofleriaceae bacterium]